MEYKSLVSQVKKKNYSGSSMKGLETKPVRPEQTFSGDTCRCRRADKDEEERVWVLGWIDEDQ